MSVRMRKSGIWVCEYHVIEEGKRKSRRDSFGKGEAAEIAAKARDLEIKTTKIKIPKSLHGPKFEELAKSYQEAKFMKAGAMSDKDKISTYHRLGANILPFFGSHHVMNFTSDLLNSYIEYRSNCWANRAQTKKISMSTIHRELSVVKAILNWSAYKQQPPLIPYNPVDKYEMPKRDDAIILPPTKDERQVIYDHAAPHVKRFIILNYNTGARSGSSELLKIQWEHVDIKANRITIISADKGGPKLRRLSITGELLEHLEIWREEDARLQECKPFLISGPIVHFKGNPILRINKAWRATLKRAGIKRRIRPYDLRHAFATDLLEAGGDIGTVSRMMGHSP